MEKEQALQLFYKHAIRRDAPAVRLRALSEEIVKRTGGLPLALEVIGSFLHGKSEYTWKATLQKLKIVPNNEVEFKLRISYDALEHEQQQMFLDIACLFSWKDKKTVAHMWEDQYKFSPEADIEVLQLLSLIKIGEDNMLRMHDQLRDLGRGIVRQENPKDPGKQSRLWGDEAVDVLLNNQMMAMKLKVLDLSYCKELARTPDLSPFCNLERLNLRDCERLQVIDPSIGKLKHLASLNMTDCHFVKELPKQLDSKEMSLELVIDGTSIKKLPTLDGLMKLETLSANNCACLTQVSSSISHLVCVWIES
ncbi:hypothetical protein CRG98_046401 [Punica granatum]|uniref:Disease resistance protein Roq1-like winged-helix domain-containing protein n=1 Tax=Punica granatum TaxID=22663 RepID=A0A2I0HNA8_PUNGR|nr:hypothetical protein CRG98_046401 [Punica granatum]